MTATQKCTACKDGRHDDCWISNGDFWCSCCGDLSEEERHEKDMGNYSDQELQSMSNHRDQIRKYIHKYCLLLWSKPKYNIKVSIIYGEISIAAIVGEWSERIDICLNNNLLSSDIENNITVMRSIYKTWCKTKIHQTLNTMKDKFFNE